MGHLELMSAAVHSAFHFLPAASASAHVKPQRTGLSKSCYRKCYFCFCQSQMDTFTLVTSKASLRVQGPCSPESGAVIAPDLLSLFGVCSW